MITPEDMDRFQQKVAWIVSQKDRYLRYVFILQAIVGIFLTLFGWRIGKTHYQLIRSGIRSQGQIVDYKKQYFNNYSSDGRTRLGSFAFMPIVEFQAQSRAVRFQDWMGSKSTGRLHDQVRIIYSAENPTTAMIDRPIANWIPWGPIILLGVFLMGVALKAVIFSRTY